MISDNQKPEPYGQSSDSSDIPVDPADLDIECPDPAGPPQAVASEKARLNLGAAATIVLVAGGSTLYFLGGQVRTCLGATRSATLQWQQRQAEIQRVLNEEETDPNGVNRDRQEATPTPE